MAQAISLKPDYVDAYNNLGGVLKAQGKLADAIAAFRAALRLKPDAAKLHSSLIATMHYHPDFDARAVLEECRRWNRAACRTTREDSSSPTPIIPIPSGGCA